MSKICPDCEGDGISRCNNPDHGFIEGMPGEVNRLGCPVCGHDPEYRVFGEKCETCQGKGTIPEDNIREEFELFIVGHEEYIDYVTNIEKIEKLTEFFPFVK